MKNIARAIAVDVCAGRQRGARRAVLCVWQQGRLPDKHRRALGAAAPLVTRALTLRQRQLRAKRTRRLSLPGSAKQHAASITQGDSCWGDGRRACITGVTDIFRTSRMLTGSRLVLPSLVFKRLSSLSRPSRPSMRATPTRRRSADIRLPRAVVPTALVAHIADDVASDCVCCRLVASNGEAAHRIIGGVDTAARRRA